MKYVIIRCEDIASPSEGLAALLEGARLPHLQQLAQAGAVGLMRQAGADRLRAHRALFGLGPDDHEASAECCYAAGANLQLAEAETAWCCEFVTSRDGMIVDPTAGRIRTKESEVLIQALDEQLGSDTRRWEVGRDAQHLLITTEPSLRRDGTVGVPHPELLVGLAWKRHLPKGPLGAALSTLIEEAAKLLESHPINRVRVDLGENPANLLWLWGGVGGEAEQPRSSPPEGHRPMAGPWSARTGLAGAVISNGFMVRGLALALGLEWKNGPSSLEEGPLAHVLKAVAGLLERHDLVYVHLSIESHDPVERLCAMERIDQLLLKPLTESLPRLGSWRLLAAVDNRMGDGVPFIGIGTGLPPRPATTLATTRLAETSLTFEDGPALFAWLTQP